LLRARFVCGGLPLVEATGFEPAASWSQTKHSTKLSYASGCIKAKLSACGNFICRRNSIYQVRFNVNINGPQQATGKPSNV